MKIEIDIPDDELRTCVSCSSGEMNLTLSLNETLDGYDVTDIVSDTYAGNTSLNFRKVEKEPCEDCISRQAVLEYIEGSEAELGHSSENELVCQDIKEFPPVTPALKVYTSDNVGDIRGQFVNAVTEVFGDSEKFFDFIENEEYISSFHDVFYSGFGECYIINRSSGEYINWYKFTHIGRDIHSTVAPDDFVKFLSDFRFLKGEYD